MLRNGTPAPGFTLRDHEGNERSLEQLSGGKPLVITFFRGTYCPTARKDLLAYNDAFRRIKTAGADLAAISADSTDELRSWHSRLGLQFPLLSDGGFAVSENYGVYRSDETDEGPQPHGEPAVFIVDVEGKLAYSQLQTGPKGHIPPPEIVMMLIYMAQNGGKYW